jgi:hypothetical protein
VLVLSVLVSLEVSGSIATAKITLRAGHTAAFALHHARRWSRRRCGVRPRSPSGWPTRSVTGAPGRGCTRSTRTVEGCGAPLRPGAAAPGGSPAPAAPALGRRPSPAVDDGGKDDRRQQGRRARTVPRRWKAGAAATTARTRSRSCCEATSRADSAKARPRRPAWTSPQQSSQSSRCASKRRARASRVTAKVGAGLPFQAQDRGDDSGLVRHADNHAQLGRPVTSFVSPVSARYVHAAVGGRHAARAASASARVRVTGPR